MIVGIIALFSGIVERKGTSNLIALRPIKMMLARILPLDGTQLIPVGRQPIKERM